MARGQNQVFILNTIENSKHARYFPCFFMNLGSYGSFDYAHSVNAKSNKKRVMDYKLICVEGIPPEYASKKILCSNSFFGRYGEITSCNVYQDENRSGLSKSYILYKQEISASLGLMGAHKVIHKGNQITVYFGTNRYCLNFLEDKKCDKLSYCNYLHQIDTQNDALRPENKRQRHVDKAINFINKNLTKVISIQIDDNRNRIDSKCCLRSIEAIFAAMIGLGKLDPHEYQKAKLRGKVTSQRTFMLTKHLNQVQTPSSLSSSAQLDSEKLPRSSQKFCQTQKKDPLPCKKYTEDQLNQIIVSNILKHFKKQKGHSRLYFAQTQNSQNEILKPKEDERSIRIRQKMSSVLKN